MIYMYRIAICDDDINFIDYIKEIIWQCELPTQETQIYEYTSGIQLLDEMNSNVYDLLILDMKMDELNGQQTAVEFRKYFPHTILVFCSGAFQPSVESFRVSPYRYLLKSFEKNRMLDEVKEIIAEMKKQHLAPDIVGKYYYNVFHFLPDDILYFESSKYGSIIHSKKDIAERFLNKKIICKMRIEELAKILKPYGFRYARSSRLVNLFYVCYMESGGRIKLENGEMMYVSRSMLSEFRQEVARVLGMNYNI